MGDSTTHAELSPSKRHRWGVCPGSIREEAKYPEPTTGPAAYDGTRTHALLEELVTGGKDGAGRAPLRAPQMLVGTVVTDEYGTYTIDQDRIDRVNVAIDYIRSLPNAHKAIAETRVYPDGLTGRADLHGTVDVQVPGEDIYHVIDYKDGMHPVEAFQNPQLEQYAIGVLAGLDTDKYPKVMRLTIIQPKLALKGMDAISSWDVTVPELMQTAKVIAAEAAATDEPNAPLVPGESQCRYCKAKGACPALAAKVSADIGLLFSAAPATVTDVATQAANKDPGTMDGAQLAQILEAAPLVEQLLKAVKDEVKRRLESNIPVPGFKLVRGNGSRGWNLSEEEMTKKLVAMGVPKSEVYVKKFISPAQVEKLVWDKKGEPVRLTKPQLEKMETEYVTKSPGGIVVAPESDRRSAVVTDASAMFGAAGQTIDVQATVVPSSPPWMTAVIPGAVPATAPVEIPPWMTAIPVPVGNDLPPWMK